MMWPTTVATPWPFGPNGRRAMSKELAAEGASLLAAGLPRVMIMQAFTCEYTALSFTHAGPRAARADLGSARPSARFVRCPASPRVDGRSMQGTV
jgi:hypothetical protein